MADWRRLKTYLRSGYQNVEGQSSLVAAEVATLLMRVQSDNGWSGSVAEVGVLRGRFSIALALALEAGERLIALDLFDDYQPGMLEKFRANLSRWSVPEGSIDAWTANSGALAADALRERVGGASLRLIHIDGEHTPEALTKDLDLAQRALAPHGIIILDDMLHPFYPRLMFPVDNFLRQNPDMRVLAIVDRASIVAASKYVICRKDDVGTYADAVMAELPHRARRDQADFGDHKAALITARSYRLAMTGGMAELLKGRVRKRMRKLFGDLRGT